MKRRVNADERERVKKGGRKRLRKREKCVVYVEDNSGVGFPLVGVRET